MPSVPGPLGFGTSRLTGDECTRAVERALDVGYRHVDTAQMYDNERAVGAALRASDVPREAVFLATKVLPSNLSYADVHESTRDSLDRLGVDAVDLLYVHWPREAYDPPETLRAFDELYDEGLTRAVGVSNFSPAQLTEALDRLSTPLAAHQVECHPLNQQGELRGLAADRGHALVGYSPFARGDILDDPTLVDVAERAGATVPAVCLAWAVARDVVPIPKARGEHVEDNWAAATLELGEDALAEIDAIDRTYQRFG